MPLSLRALASRLPLLAFPSSGRLFPLWTKLQATQSQVWKLVEFLLVTLRTTRIPREVILSTK